MSDRNRFETALAANEDDLPLRLAFADWLDERGEHEEADRHRKWPQAKSWLMGFCKANNVYDFEWTITYEDLVKFGIETLSTGDGYLSCGNNETFCDAMRTYCQEVLEQVSVLTGLPVHEDAVENCSFKCAC